MLYAVLLVVLAAFGLLVTALVSTHTLWAWLSVALSAVAAALLVADWWLRRRASAAARVQEADGTVVIPEDSPTEGAESTAERVTDTSGVGTGDTAEGDSGEPLGATSGPPGDSSAPDVPPPEDEPAVEDTDAADILIVADLTDEVRVIDERPRYHLPSCDWLADRPTIPLPVREARQLGFTPCARCSPDRSLAAAHRRTRQG
ncbi:hypothetical protein [Gandjariella thermophila]|uniref:Uncharacterized protein n=1 Tax=Gandjariella thermophila TaxID=1931992 RepID=A0A4D4JBU3_9PSEU|nr:hypothetical protein [Gandjariella thermophila]GDY32802.1 hypothetical protein GTS_44350 [Gandjariella thermophila]